MPPTRDDRAREWMGQALCAQVQGDLWFPKKGGTPHDAIDVCSRCPVVDDCYDYALSLDPPPDGVWGGHTAAHRALARVKGPLR